MNAFLAIALYLVATVFLCLLAVTNRNVYAWIMIFFLILSLVFTFRAAPDPRRVDNQRVAPTTNSPR